MSSSWPLVRLGELLSYRKEFIEIDELQMYKRCRVQLHAQGIVLRDHIPGAEIKTKSQQVCRAGEFLVAEIDAKLGGYGIVPSDLEGAIVSSHYFLFGVNEDRLIRSFLGYFIRTPAFFDQVAAQGSTNYAAIRPSHVLEYTIPLPPPTEQRRLIERIDALATKIEEANRLRSEAIAERSAIEASFTNSLFANNHGGRTELRPLGELAEIQSGVTLGRTLTGPTVRKPYLRVANVQDGHFNLSVIKEIDIRPDEFSKWKLVSGDLLLTEGGDWDKLGRGSVWRGEITDCIHQNHIFRVRVDPTVLDPEYLAILTASPYGKEYFQVASKQTTNLASINQRQLKAFPVILPLLAQQQRTVDLVKRLREKLTLVWSQQKEVETELKAMLPAILDRAFRGELL